MKVIVLSTQRVGSMMFLSFLNSHLQLTSLGEESSKFLSKMPDNSIVSIKYNFWQKDLIPDIRQYKMIHLMRKDLLNLTISNILNDNKSLHKRPAHILTLQKKRLLESKNLKIRIKPDLLKSKIEDIYHEVITWYRRFQNISVLFFYEDITDNQNIQVMPKKITVKILKHLGVRYQKLITSLHKVNENNEKNIVNWDEIKDIGLKYRGLYIDEICKGGG